MSWLPTSDAVLMNSSKARFMFATYQGKANIEPAVAKKNVRQQRVKSIFADHATPINQSINSNRMNYSLDDMQSELRQKFSEPNLGLKSSHDRLLGQKPQLPLSEWQKLCAEFKERVEARQAKTKK